MHMQSKTKAPISFFLEKKCMGRKESILPDTIDQINDGEVLNSSRLLTLIPLFIFEFVNTAQEAEDFILLSVCTKYCAI